MCHYITATLPHAVELQSVAPIFESHKLGFELISNPHVAEQVDPQDWYILTNRKHCDCGTALGSLNHQGAAKVSNYDRELKKISRQPPLALELRRAKDYSIGQMRLGLESTSNQMMWIGEHLLAYGFVLSPDEIEKKIEAVTTDEVQSVTAALFRDHRLNAAVITPSKDEKATGELLHFGL